MWFCECLTQFGTWQQANNTSPVDTGYRKTGLVWKCGTPAALSTPSCLLLVVLSSSPGISKPHRGSSPFRIAVSLHPSLVPTCNTSTGKQLNFSWNCISSVWEVSCFIAYWLHIPRTSAVQVKTLIKVSEHFTKEELCKILCLCQNVLPSPAMLNKNFWLQVHTIKHLPELYYSCILWNPKSSCWVHNSPPLIPLLSQMNPVHALLSHLRYHQYYLPICA
jgi:hypothetical protein